MTALARRTLITATGLAAALSGCARPDGQRPSTSETPDASPDTTATPARPVDASALLVFFSRPGENYWYGGLRDLDLGNTKRLAQMIAERIDCDTYEIRPADPYPQAYDSTVKRNRQEQAEDARPEIAGDLPDVSDYETVLLGSPVWSSSAPMIMSTFIDSVDLTGTTVLPFVTYAVSGMSGIDQDYRDALPEVEVVDGLAVQGEEVDEAAGDVAAWLRENGLG